MARAAEKACVHRQAHISDNETKAVDCSGLEGRTGQAGVN